MPEPPVPRALSAIEQDALRAQLMRRIQQVTMAQLELETARHQFRVAEIRRCETRVRQAWEYLYAALTRLVRQGQYPPEMLPALEDEPWPK